MKKVGDLFAELGFRQDAPDSVKRAFVENLVKAAAQNAPRAAQNAPQAAQPAEREAAPRTRNASEQTPTKAFAKGKREDQLSFDLDSLEKPETSQLVSKRTAG